MVAIFLSVFDVHVQRAPIGGTIQFVQYNKGKFLDARDPNASLQNENRVVGIESADGFRVTVRQISGLIARRIVGWAESGRAIGERGTVWYDSVWFTRGVVPAAGHGNRRQGGGLRERW